MLPDFSHCETKYTYRQKAIIDTWNRLSPGSIPKHRHYVTLCGPLDFSSPGNELVQLGKAGMFTMDQVHGIERDKAVYLKNRRIASQQKARPNIHHGDLVPTLRHLFETVPGFSPAVINMDLMVGPRKALQDLDNVTETVRYNMADEPTMLVWNTMLQRGGGTKWSSQLEEATEWMEQSDEWTLLPYAVEYLGTGNTHTLMHTRVLVRGYFANTFDIDDFRRERWFARH